LNLFQTEPTVNNAAFQTREDALAEISEEQWDHTFRTNIYGYFNMAKAALPHLGRGAVVINTGSITGLERQQAASRQPTRASSPAKC
jgi:NAD(P)-dependent dehydrogenase (short-subunit alcohol dehydrogenase family)